MNYCHRGRGHTIERGRVHIRGRDYETGCPTGTSEILLEEFSNATN
jgi:hypothetical protein